MTSENTSLARVKGLTRVLDGLYVDPIVGFLLPGAGDIVTGAAGLYLILVAVSMGVRRIVIARMLLNLSVDILIGMIPFVGDVFDFVWKANQKNLALLERRAEAPSRVATAADWLYVLGAILVFLAALALPVVLLVWALTRLF